MTATTISPEDDGGRRDSPGWAGNRAVQEYQEAMAIRRMPAEPLPPPPQPPRDSTRRGEPGCDDCALAERGVCGVHLRRHLLRSVGAGTASDRIKWSETVTEPTVQRITARPSEGGN